MTIIKHLTISGRVQGIGFRYSMIRKAQQLGVTGWVRNRHDGTVEAMVQGSQEAVAQMLEWAKKGPGMAEVKHVEVTEGHGNYDRFSPVETE